MGRSKRLLAGLGVGLAALGCSGVKDIVSPPPPPAPAPPPTPPAPPPLVPSAEVNGPLGSPQIFAVHTDPTGCAWILWDANRHARHTGTSKTCPREVRWAPDGARVMALVDDSAIFGDWPLADSAKTIPTPADVRAIWQAENGDVRIATVTAATVSRAGTFLVYEAGGEKVRVPSREDTLGKYGVKGTTLVMAGAGDRQVEVTPGGEDVVATFYELSRNDTWTVVGRFPARDGGDLQADPLTTGGPLREEEAGWGSMAKLLRESQASTAQPPPELQQDPALRTAVGASADGDMVGFLSFGSGGFLYRVAWGDTPHAMPPLFWCSERKCPNPVRLPVDDAQVAVNPLGDLALVAEEYTGAHPKVFAPGNPVPLLYLPGAEHAVWAPQPAWLGPAGRQPGREEHEKAKSGKNKR